VGARSVGNLQDPLSYRSIVQLGGAARDALAFVRSQLAIELNAHHDNPIVTPDGDRIISAGNYEALPVAAALDFLRIALRAGVDREPGAGHEAAEDAAVAVARWPV
jgi:histidine ammonia-lyase